MSGIRAYTFREGDRSEYLANYLLSGLGIVTPVPRQEDTGFDFYCQLADQENGNLSFGFPFILQTKSDTSSITHGNEDPKNWKKENIEWLNRLKLPLFFGVVNKKDMVINIFNCSALRFIFIENPDASIIEFKPRDKYSTADISRPARTRLDKFPDDNSKGDGYKYIVDLGNPLISISNEDIYDKDILKFKKDLLRNMIAMEQLNDLYKNLSVPHFHWSLNIETNVSFKAGWIYLTSDNPTSIQNHFKTLGPALISLALNSFTCGQQELIDNLKPLIKQIPKEYITQALKDKNPDIFI